MTQEFANFLTTKKAELSGWLAGWWSENASTTIGNIGTAFVTDGRIKEYIARAALSPAEHCVLELAGIKRFIEHASRPDVTFDPRSYKAFVNLHETVKLDTESGRQAVKISPCQAFEFASIYGLKTHGDRLHQKVVLYFPRKYGKTTTTSVMALDEMLNGPKNGQVFFAANSKEQAKDSMSKLTGIVRGLDPKEAVFKTQRDRVVWNTNYAGASESFIRAVASNPDTLDGLHASMVILDEYSQTMDCTLKNVLTTSMKGRRNPLVVIITTASDKFAGQFYLELEAYKRILLGLEDEPDDAHPIFLHLFEPDPADDPFDVATWKKVHPHFGVTVTEQDYKRDLAEAQVSGARGLVDFKTKMLNIFTTETGTEWISAQKIMDASPERFEPSEFATKDVMAFLTLDLADKNDLASFTTTVYSPKTKKFYFHTRFYFPEGRLATTPNRNLLERWSDGGYVKLIKGDFIDQRVICEDILETVRQLGHRVKSIGYDRWHAAESKNIITAAGYGPLLKSVDQRNANMTILIDFFESAVNRGQVQFDKNPIIEFCFANAILVRDDKNNARLDKRGGNTGSLNPNKIDGAITCVMGMDWFVNNA